MKKQNYLITWYTQLDNGYIDTRQVTCKSQHSVNVMYDKLAQEKNTLLIEVEEL